MSEHKLALTMAHNNDQIQPKQKKKPIILHHKQMLTKAPRKIKPTQRPQTTNVLECSNALTGVGATIAFNSQLEKGYCADLENIMHSKHSPITVPDHTHKYFNPNSIKSNNTLTNTQLKLFTDCTIESDAPLTIKPPNEYNTISNPINAISPKRLYTMALIPELTFELQKLTKK